MSVGQLQFHSSSYTGLYGTSKNVLLNTLKQPPAAAPPHPMPLSLDSGCKLECSVCHIHFGIPTSIQQAFNKCLVFE